MPSVGKNFFLSLLCFGFISCRSETGSETDLHNTHILKNTTRVHLLHMQVIGYPDLAERVTSLDAGVRRNADNQCEFLEPKTPSVRTRGVDPLHLYSNVTARDGKAVAEDPAEVFLGETDFYRHGDMRKNFRDTQAPKLEGVQIQKVASNMPQGLLYLVKFEHKNYAFKTFLQIQTENLDSGECSARVHICEVVHGSDEPCEVNNLERRIGAITVHVNLEQFWSPIAKVVANTDEGDYLFANEKNKKLRK